MLLNAFAEEDEAEKPSDDNADGGTEALADSSGGSTSGDSTTGAISAAPSAAYYRQHPRNFKWPDDYTLLM